MYVWSSKNTLKVRLSRQVHSRFPSKKKYVSSMPNESYDEEVQVEKNKVNGRGKKEIFNSLMLVKYKGKSY